jgi:hypothetical protein
MCRHTASRGCIVERKDGVSSTTRFECTNLLKILALKKERGPARLIQSRAREHKRAMNMRPNPLVR